MEAEQIVLIRHSRPNKYDQAPYGALCKVISDHKESETYKQTSNDPDCPIWEYVEQ